MKELLKKHKNNLISHGVSILLMVLTVLYFRFVLDVTNVAFFSAVSYFIGAALHRAIYKYVKGMLE